MIYRPVNFRYTEWVKLSSRRWPNWSAVEASELYDLERDPDEQVNLAVVSAKETEILRRELSLALRKKAANQRQ